MQLKNISRVLCLFVLVAGVSFAEFIDFTIPAGGGGGSISYAGGVNPLIGTNLAVSTITGVNGVPLNNGVALPCVGCVINFQTGVLSGTSGLSWSFAPGGTFTLTGTIPSLTGGTPTTLMSGYFMTDSIVAQLPIPPIPGLGAFSIAGAAFSSILDPALTNFYGTLPDPARYASNFNISFFTNGTPAGAFTSNAIASGNLTAAAPEPVSIVLLGTALIGCAAIGRRRLKRS
ncbi:MAG: PEP-CTERM sorting domain-containing protein [Bryobacterales bacterium]|nr:PEP-CTERM sorting domain-containing protein [Bryobacterales bacterium]